jgi:dTDP-4-amino-4,6-dideoxygalactose transaminase
MAEISLLSVSPEVQHAWHLYPILLNPDRLRIDRAGFIRALKRHNIGSSVHFIPLHLHPYYRDRYKYRPRDFPAATQAYERLVSLPLYTQMSPGDVCDVIGAVAEVIRESRL